MKRKILILLFVLSLNLVFSQSGFLKKHTPSLKKVDFKNSVIYFLAPRCKLCISKAVDIKQTLDYLNNSKNEINVYFVFHKNTSLKDQKKMLKLFKLDSKKIIHINDIENDVSNLFDVSITPSVILINLNGEILYEGALDDKDISLSESKFEKSLSFIDKALESYLNGKTILINKTEAVGCIYR